MPSKIHCRGTKTRARGVDVVRDGALEERRLLLHERERAAQRAQRQRGRARAVDEDLAVELVEAEERAEERIVSGSSVSRSSIRIVGGSIVLVVVLLLVVL